MAQKIGYSVKKGSQKVISTFIGVVILISGLIAAVITVLNPQLFSPSAQVLPVSYGVCPDGCRSQNLPGTYPCTNSLGVTKYCCPDGQVVINSGCVNKPGICTTSGCAPFTSGTTNGPVGSTPCYNRSGVLKFCCAGGSVVYDNVCTKCGKSECTLNSKRCETYKNSNGTTISEWQKCTSVNSYPGCPNINLFITVKSCGKVSNCSNCSF